MLALRSYPDRQSLYSGRSLPVLVSISFPWFTPHKHKR